MSFTLNEISVPSFNAQDFKSRFKKPFINTISIGFFGFEQAELQSADSSHYHFVWLHFFWALKPTCRVMLVQIVFEEASGQFKSLSHQQWRVFIPCNQCARPRSGHRSTVQNLTADFLDRWLNKEKFSWFSLRSEKVLQGLCMRTENILDFILYFSILIQPSLIGKNASYIARSATLSKWNVQWVELKAHSVLSETQSCNILSGWMLYVLLHFRN